MLFKPVKFPSISAFPDISKLAAIISPLAFIAPFMSMVVAAI